MQRGGSMKNLENIKKSPLFKGLDGIELIEILDALEVRVKACKKGEFVFYQGDPVYGICLVGKGSANIMREDTWGRESLITKVEEGDIFGEVFVCYGIKKYPVAVRAEEDSEILFLNYEKILNGRGSLDNKLFVKLQKNMIEILALKNHILSEKIQHITRPNTREKLMSFLSSFSKSCGRKYFDIPFTRQELANYLSVDRSAMCTEITKMKNDKLIDCNGKTFKIIDSKQ